MKNSSMFQKLEVTLAIVSMITAIIGTNKNILSVIVLSLLIFSICLSNLQYSCTKDEIKELQEKVKTLENK